MRRDEKTTAKKVLDLKAEGKTPANILAKVHRQHFEGNGNQHEKCRGLHLNRIGRQKMSYWLTGLGILTGVW